MENTEDSSHSPRLSSEVQMEHSSGVFPTRKTWRSSMLEGTGGAEKKDKATVVISYSIIIDTATKLHSGGHTKS